MLKMVLGYLGTALVIFSFFFDNIIILRAFNMAGAFILCLYAIMIHAWPILLLDGFLFALNSYKLSCFFRKRSASPELTL